MKTVQMRQTESNTLTIVVDPTKVARGLMTGRSGTVTMGDRRTKRCKTRAAQRKLWSRD
jgi:hypothetical protein